MDRCQDCRSRVVGLDPPGVGAGLDEERAVVGDARVVELRFRTSVAWRRELIAGLSRDAEPVVAERRAIGVPPQPRDPEVDRLAATGPGPAGRRRGPASVRDVNGAPASTSATAAVAVDRHDRPPESGCRSGPAAVVGGSRSERQGGGRHEVDAVSDRGGCSTSYCSASSRGSSAGWELSPLRRRAAELVVDRAGVVDERAGLVVGLGGSVSEKMPSVDLGRSSGLTRQ